MLNGESVGDVLCGKLFFDCNVGCVDCLFGIENVCVFGNGDVVLFIGWIMYLICMSNVLFVYV